MMYTVGEIAKKLNVTASTLRYYDKEGLLPFVKRSDGGIRIFSDDDMSSLKVIECLKKTGMPIREIGAFIDLCMQGDATISRRLALILAQKKAVEARLDELRQTQEMLEYKQWYYETAQAAGSCAVHGTLTEQDVPARFRRFWQPPDAPSACGGAPAPGARPDGTAAAPQPPHRP